MSDPPPVLHMFCGKVASGKSTLASDLARRPGMVLVSEDAWQSALFADQLKTVADYVRCSDRLRAMMGPHVSSLLNAGVSVVLDFQANTLASRAWMRSILEATQASHVLHVLDTPDEICRARLHPRNTGGAHPFTVTDAQFDQVSAYFVPPTPEEGFNVVRHVAEDREIQS